MKVLIDQSGYHMQNLGDIAMLQSAIKRVRELVPDATITVATLDDDRLLRFCPGVAPINAQWPSERAGRFVPSRVRDPLSIARKMLLASRYGGLRHAISRAAADADVVISSGGGFLTDAFWWHAVGVLGTLRVAQRSGVATAMFGQGIGPLTHPSLDRACRAVLPGLKILGVREGAASPDEALRLGVEQARMRITGDDALEIAARQRAPVDTAIGVNIRTTAYTATTVAMAENITSAIAAARADLGLAVRLLPISTYASQSDAEASASALRAVGVEFERPSLEQPADLADAVSSCAVVVTSSYHAAVFALAQGIPVVGLVATAYYAGKFEGLQGFYPRLVHTVMLDDPALHVRLRKEIVDAAVGGRDHVLVASQVTQGLLASGREAYRQFFVGALTVSERC